MSESDIVGRRLELKQSVVKALRAMLRKAPDAATLDGDDIAWCWSKARESA